MKNQNPDLRNFLTGAIGYSLGAIGGFVFIFLVARLGVVEWLVDLIDKDQTFWQLLGIILIPGFILALAGAVIGGIGGTSLKRIMGLEHRSQAVL